MNINWGEVCFLYRINLRLIEDSNFAAHKKRYKIYRPEMVDRKLGIIVGSEFPAECLEPFPLYTVSGKVEVQLELVRQVTEIRETVLASIVKFQTKVVPWVLQSQVSWTELDPQSSDYLIVPIDRTGAIDERCLREVLSPPWETCRSYVFEVKYFHRFFFPLCTLIITIVADVPLFRVSL